MKEKIPTKKMKSLREDLSVAEKARDEESVLEIEKEIRKLETGGKRNIPTTAEKPAPEEAPAPWAPGDIETGFNVDIDSEKLDVEKEIKNLSPEEKEKIGWGLSTIGFKVEKAKNDFFANAFNINQINKKGTVGRFCTELRNYFIQNVKTAEKKANDTSAFTDTKFGINIKGQKRGINISAEKQKAMSNLGALSGNLLRYGRMATDFTGASLASPLRYVMMAGMATTVLATAGKEARLKNEDVIEKTRIQDADLASEEAWKIYQNAQKKIESGENKNVSVEALKNAYMMEMPKDLQERLKNPSTANSFIQDVVKTDLQFTINMLNKKIEKIENNSKLSPEQKEIEKEKLLIKQKGNLEDYDRIITQYGTVDALAMAGRYAQTVGKTVVAVVTVETLLLSVEKIWGTASNIYHHFHDAHEALVSTPTPTQVSPPAPVPETPPAINGDAIVHQGQGIEHPLIKQIDANPKLAQELGFKGDIHDKVALHKFAGQEAHRIAEKMGYVGKGGQEIRITEANKIAFELKVENGHSIVIEKTIDGKIIETYDSKEGYEFGKTQNNQYEKEVNIARPKIAPQEIEKNEPTPPPEKVEPVVTETHITEPTPTEKLRTQIEEKIDAGKEKTDIADLQKHRPSLGYKTVGIGTPISVGTPVETGSMSGTGEVFAGNYQGNQSVIVVEGHEYFRDPSSGQYHDAFNSKQYFPEITPEENVILQNHPEFAENPFNLPGKELMQSYNARLEDMNHLFKNEALGISRLSRLKVSSLLIHANESTSNDPIIKHLSEYVILLKNSSGLEPTGLLERSETTQDYIAKAYQTLAAGKGKMSLEKFQEILRK